MKTFDLLGVNIAAIDIGKAYAHILEWVNLGQKVYVCVAPVSTVVDCQRLEGYRTIINGAAMTTPDGMPVVWYGKTQGYDVSRTYGPDLMMYVFDKGREVKLKHYIYGSTQGVCEKFVKSMQERFAGICIVGWETPDYTPDAVKLDAAIAGHINHVKPDIIWVALGSPKQDFWMHMNRHVLDASVLIGVGAAIDFLSGEKPQAPSWMRGIGLEWVFRLCCEPRRLWRRYLIGNSLFIYYLILQALGLGKSQKT